MNNVQNVKCKCKVESKEHPRSLVKNYWIILWHLKFKFRNLILLNVYSWHNVIDRIRRKIKYEYVPENFEILLNDFWKNQNKFNIENHYV